jgi:hypothetical protein
MNKNNLYKKIIGLFGLTFLFTQSYAQTNIGDGTGSLIGQKLNTITTAVPFLLIAPDSKAGAMGEAGVATEADANSIHWNPAKMTFAQDEMGVAISYSPWLRELVPDISLSYLSFYKKIDKMSSFGASLRYFSLGDITFTNEFGEEIRSFEPKEVAFDVAYSRLLAEKLSGGIALRYVNSNLTGGQIVQGANTRSGRAIAVDVSAYYVDDKIKIAEKDAEFAFGINISNIGNKMSYSTSAKRDFIPINLRIGPRLTTNIDNFNKITVTLDINKLLVPTTPFYARDSNNVVIRDSNGDYVILSGKDPDRAVASGMFGSFSDAPGDIYMDQNGEYQVVKGSVFKEELREINYALGLEYWYGTQFAIRAGYFYEHALKGNRKFVTLGAGLRYNVFAIDLAYLVPMYFRADVQQNNPLKNTLRFTLSFSFDAFKSQNDSPQQP